MNAVEINEVQNQYDRVKDAIGKAVKADPSLVTVENWFAHLCGSEDVTEFAVTPGRDGDVVVVNFEVYTSTTGGSYEHPEAEIPLDTLNRYL